MVTPVRADSPSITVAYPTVTPETSVMALHSPVAPSNGIPRSRARVMSLSFCDLYQLLCNALHYFIGHSIYSLGLNARIDAIVDVIDDNEIFKRERDLGGEPIQFANGCDALCNLMQGGKFVSMFVLLRDS